MNKGQLSQFFKGNTTHRIRKIMTLAVTSFVLVTMITIDASASSFAQGNRSNRANLESTLTSTSSFRQLTGSAGRWHPWSPPANPSPTSGGATSTTSSQTTGTTQSQTTTTTDPPTTTTTQSQTTTTSPPTTTTTDPPTTTTTDPPTTTTAPTTSLAFPIGTTDSSEPSGYAPPGAGALAGYTQTYVTDFNGSSLPSAWSTYEGQPGGDSGAQFDQGHVTVNGGLLNINTYQDPAFNNEWVTGGACLCNAPSQTYGAYFVRSRMTGPGPTGVELLWPTANVWPPEIDFNETNGGVSNTTATAHYGASNSEIGRSLSVNMTQWHTWGVIWTATSIQYTVDGNVWATVTTPASIPNIPMHLSLQSQTWCSSGWACPSAPQTMQVDWVAQYSSN
jgi:hypothetical protein